VRPVKIENWPKRHDPSGVNLFVRHVVVTLDVIDADGIGNSRLLIEVEQIALQIRVINNAAKVAFEMAMIDDIEANQCAKEPPIGFDDPLAK
jgi:hypothetical protein